MSEERNNKRPRLEGYALLHKDPVQYVEQARGGDFFTGRDMFLKHVTNPDAADADLEYAVRTNNQQHVVELESALNCVRGNLGSALHELQELADLYKQKRDAYNKAKSDYDRVAVKVHRAKAILSNSSRPLIRDPTPQRAENIMESINRQLGDVYAPEMARKRTGFYSLSDIRRVSNGAVLSKVLEGLSDSNYNSNPDFKRVMFNLYGKRVFHRENFPLTRVLSWHGYSWETKVYLLGMYLDVEDLEEEIERHLKQGEKFETAEGKGKSPWSGTSYFVLLRFNGSCSIFSISILQIVRTSPTPIYPRKTSTSFRQYCQSH